MHEASPGIVVGGKFRIERVLSETRMCLVAVARHRHLGIPVAIKVLSGDFAASQESRARFLREGQLASLLKSEHVVRILDVGVTDEGSVPYLAMEFLDGHDFAFEVAAQVRVPEAAAVSWMIDACEAIAEAHAMGIIHRDIKPSNLFLTLAADGSPLVKVLDFGIASASAGPADTRMTATTDIMGTPLYMSPEVLESARRADVRSDIWALGATLYELLTGRVPYPGGSMVEVYACISRGAPPSLRSLRPELSFEIEQVVMRCLAFSPDARFQNVPELVEALAQASLPATAAERTARVRRIAEHAAARRHDAHAAVASIGASPDTYMPISSAVIKPRARALPIAIFAGAAALSFVLGSAAVYLTAARPAPTAAAPPSSPPSSAPVVASAPPPQETSAPPLTPSAPVAETAMASASASASARPRAKATGPAPARTPRESDFATDPHR